MKKRVLLTLACMLCGVASAQKSLTLGVTDDLTVKFDTRITFDAAAYHSHTDLSGVRYEGSDFFRYSSGANLSQLRLGFLATLGRKWSAKFDANYSDRRVSLMDVVINYQMRPNSKLIIGYYKDPVSMENNTASKYLSVATPMAVSMLSRGERYVGLTYVQWGRQYWFSGGLYGGSLSPSSMPAANRGDDGWGLGLRAAYVPIDNEYTTLHVGISGRWRKPDGLGSSIRSMVVGGLPETMIDRHAFVSAVVPDVRDYWVAGAEVAFKFDKFFLTGEYLVNRFNMLNDAQNLIHGWTLTGSYMIFGKQRRYQKADAVFNPSGNLTNKGGLEIIGRLGQVNLNDLHNDISPLLGGSAFSAMFGLNWYPMANLLFGINYTYTGQDEYADSMGRIRMSNGRSLTDGLNFSALNLRAQVIF